MKLPGMLLFLVLLSGAACSQVADKPRLSPTAIASARYKDSYVKITYGRPFKNGRVIFGQLVPYGLVWRAGANEASEITVTRDLKIDGNDLKAGTYSLFVIPEKDKWTVIFNADLGMWGAYNYNQKMDVLRLDVPVVQVTDVVYEQFTIAIDQKNEKADVMMAWDQTKTIIPIQFSEPKP
jgi:hypothetical protein